MKSSLELQPLIETLNNAQIFVKNRSHFSPVLHTTSRALLRLSQFLGRPLRLAVLGESNAGKTTITNLIAGGITLPVLPVANTRLPTFSAMRLCLVLKPFARTVKSLLLLLITSFLSQTFYVSRWGFQANISAG